MDKKIVFIALFFAAISLIARENPFEPVKTSTTTGKATYKQETMKSFQEVRAQLPSSARILKTVEFSFQNLDGSIEKKSLQVDKKIDWHDELVVKKANDVAQSMPKLPKSMPKTNETKPKTTIQFKNIVSFTISDKEIQIQTVDKKMRDFLVTNPHKIVLDFKKEISFYTKVYNLKTKFFKSIAIGKHNGYYRVAIELDGKYLYDLKAVSKGYLINLK